MDTKKNAAGQESDMRMRISALISQIRCRDTQECLEDASTQLLAIGSPAVPALLEAVRLEKGEARLEIAKLLRRLADPPMAGALVELLSDDDFDVRWEAAEGLSALGYDGLEPLISAIIKTPGSMKLRNGAHHVLHHIASQGYYTLLKPLMMAIEGAIPNVEVPAAARKVQSELART
jgi:HEAT repeat protein